MTPKSKALQTSSAPTPFNIIGSGIKSLGKGIKTGISKGVDSLITPEINRQKIQNTRMSEMSRKAKAGEFN